MALSPQTLEKMTIANSIGLVFLLVYAIVSQPEERSSNAPKVIQTMSKNPVQSTQNSASSYQGGAIPQSGATNFGELLTQTIEPLQRAVTDHNDDLELPTDDEINAAIASNDLNSPASLVVLEKLKNGYSRYNMPFPKLQIPEQSSSAPMINQVAEPPPNLEEWLRQRVVDLQQELQRKEESELGLIPSEGELQAAIQSQSLQSEEGRLVVDMLKNGYARMQMPFPEFGLSQDTATVAGEVNGPANSPPNISNNKILAAYFKGQLQRLELEARSQQKNIDSILPTEAQIQAATESGALQSEASKEVLQAIQNCYDALGLQFYSPKSQ